MQLIHTIHNKHANSKYSIGPYPGRLMYFHLGKLQLPWEGGDGKTKLNDRIITDLTK